MDVANEQAEPPSSPNEVAQPSPLPKRPLHHHAFYLSGQTVVFRVQDTLFKVDPTIFANGKDSESRFKVMLDSSQHGNSPRTGSDDYNPIVLEGDTSADFASLLWGLQSQKLSLAKVAEDDIERFINMARICHKYYLWDLEAWAITGLDRLAQRNNVVRGSQAAQFLEIFAFCDRADAVQSITSTIETMLKGNVCSTTEIATFINLGHKLDLKRLVVLGYYAMALKPRNEWEAELSFSPAQRHLLLSGYYSLSEYPIERAVQSLGEEFRRVLDGSTGIPDYWHAFSITSKEAALRSEHNIKIVDIAGRLRCLVDAFIAAGWASEEAILRSSLEKIIDRLVENEFHDYFSDYQA